MEDALNLNNVNGQVPKINALVKKIKDVYALETTFSEGFDYIVVGHRLLSMLCDSKDFEKTNKVESNRMIEAGYLFKDVWNLKVLLDTSLPWDKPQIHFMKKNGRTYMLQVIYDK